MRVQVLLDHARVFISLFFISFSKKVYSGLFYVNQMTTEPPGKGTTQVTSQVQKHSSGPARRRKLLAWVEPNSYKLLGGVSIRERIEWEKGRSIRRYTHGLRSRLWGGALEITILSIL